MAQPKIEKIKRKLTVYELTENEYEILKNKPLYISKSFFSFTNIETLFLSFAIQFFITSIILT